MQKWSLGTAQRADEECFRICVLSNGWSPVWPVSIFISPAQGTGPAALGAWGDE